jgi:hypothetical protein
MLIQTVDRDTAICKSRSAASRRHSHKRSRERRRSTPLPPRCIRPQVPLVDGNDVRAAIG